MDNARSWTDLFMSCGTTETKSIMNPASLSALAALSGSAVGGLTSFFSSWLGQSGQLRSQLFLNDKGRRQELYREFVDEASRLYIDSLTRDTPDLTRLVALYALISRMRVLSSPKVIEEAETVGQLIVRSYPEPNKTFADLRAMVYEHAFDPLRSFSESCREELEGLK
jgi:hypothetical protein